jgi:sucrose-phosphate synthase
MLGLGMSDEEAEKKFKFTQRIAAEDEVLSLAQFIVTSTEQEISSYQVYSNFSSAEYHVLPPGIDMNKFFPYYQDKVAEDIGPEEMQRKYWVSEYIEKFLTNPHKPVIMALSRPDRRKNLHTLIDVYGQYPGLQSLANLVIFAGIRKDINKMPPSEKEVLTNILLSMDKYDLYGKLAIPKKHDVENEVDTIYRYCAEKRGAFVNLTLYENFGLTTIEAGASGLPVVVTCNGGPSEIIPICKNGILVDPLKPEQIKEALVSILTDEDLWKSYSNNGILNVQREFSWDRHVEWYLELVYEHVEMMNHTESIAEDTREFQLLQPAKQMLITDIDGTLILPQQGNPGLEELVEQLRNRESGMVFAVASGRNLELVQEAIDKYHLPVPDIIVSSVGSEIHYVSPELIKDKGWANFLTWRWKKEEIKSKLNKVPWLDLQEEAAQREFKVSYHYKPAELDMAELQDVLGKSWHQVNMITSHGRYLDILPKRASKGQALKFICQKWSIPMDCVYAAGDSGNDLEMFRGPVKGIVVGNRSQELDFIKPGKSIFLAENPAAEGITEGLIHYGFEF